MAVVVSSDSAHSAEGIVRGPRACGYAYGQPIKCLHHRMVQGYENPQNNDMVIKNNAKVIMSINEAVPLNLI